MIECDQNVMAGMQMNRKLHFDLKMDKNSTYMLYCTVMIIKLKATILVYVD